MRGLPQFLVDELKLRRARRSRPGVDYIRSPNVAAGAQLGRSVGIGELVVVNDGVTVGDYSYINRAAILFSGSIGKFCSIAHFAQIGAERHPVRHLSTSPFMYSDRSITGQPSGFVEIADPPVIGHDVWIGSAAVVMQGVTIGHGAIVAAGAVITRDVEPYQIVGGVPAKPMGTRFDAATVRRLLDWRWWELPDDELRALGPLVKAGEGWPSFAP
jgi:virginiamycin A acetyltransferase